MQLDKLSKLMFFNETNYSVDVSRLQLELGDCNKERKEKFIKLM